MPQDRRFKYAVAGALAAAASVSALAPAQARSPYDGRWYVMIRSVSSGCIPSMGYSLVVRGGNVIYPGSGPIRVGGKVDDRGLVNVGIRTADRSAHARGHLGETAGRGTWRGTAPGQTCFGEWRAQRSR